MEKAERILETKGEKYGCYVFRECSDCTSFPTGQC